MSKLSPIPEDISVTQLKVDHFDVSEHLREIKLEIARLQERKRVFQEREEDILSLIADKNVPPRY